MEIRIVLAAIVPVAAAAVDVVGLVVGASAANTSGNAAAAFSVKQARKLLAQFGHETRYEVVSLRTPPGC